MIFYFIFCLISDFVHSVTYNVQFSSDEDFENPGDESFHVETRSRGSKENLITKRIVSALDNYKISDRAAAHIIAAVLDALGLSIDNYKCSRTAIRDARKRERKNIATNVKMNLKVIFRFN